MAEGQEAMMVINSDAPIRHELVKRYIIAMLENAVRVNGWAKNFDDATDEVKLKARTKVYDDFYKDLDALDSKASGLASANAIIFTLLTLLLDRASVADVPLLLKIAYVMSALSLVSALSVAFVRWANIDELERSSLEGMVERICKVRNARTQRYRLAVYCALISAIVACFYFADAKIMPGIAQFVSRSFFLHP